MKEWQYFQEEAARRDHRKIGKVSILLKITLTTQKNDLTHFL